MGHIYYGVYADDLEPDRFFLVKYTQSLGDDWIDRHEGGWPEFRIQANLEEKLQEALLASFVANKLVKGDKASEDMAKAKDILKSLVVPGDYLNERGIRDHGTSFSRTFRSDEFYFHSNKEDDDFPDMDYKKAQEFFESKFKGLDVNISIQDQEKRYFDVEISPKREKKAKATNEETHEFEEFGREIVKADITGVKSISIKESYDHRDGRAYDVEVRYTEGGIDIFFIKFGIDGFQWEDFSHTEPMGKTAKEAIEFFKDIFDSPPDHFHTSV